MRRSFWCRIGLHRWEQSRPLRPEDGFPFHGDRSYRNPIRRCARLGCGVWQRWLPGYGGSTFGDWCSPRENQRLVYRDGLFVAEREGSEDAE